MTFFDAYVGVIAGIIISVLLPIFIQQYPKPVIDGKRATTWLIAKPYLALGAGSLLTGLLLVLFLRDWLTTWTAAIFAGYAWDSTLQKIGKR